MFFTDNCAETTVGPFLGKDKRSWRCVEWCLNAPWFWVTVRQRNSEYSAMDFLMVSTPKDIEWLVHCGQPSLDTEVSQIVEEVQFVSPPRLNRSGTWLMEPLDAVISGYSLDAGRTVHLFRCRNGKLYGEEGVYDTSPRLKDCKVIFSAPGIQPAS